MISLTIMKLLPRRLQRLARDERGVSAVEFAMLLPLMVTLYLGGVEVSQGISIDRKVTLTARTVADLVSQVASINNSGMSNVLQASSAVLSPYPVDKAKVRVTLVKIDNNSNATVEWSDSLNGSARAKGSSVTLPGALLVPNTSMVWGEVEYAYKPTVGYVVTGTMTLKDQIFMRPRLSDTITRTSS
ncbi:MAG: pilus assembly protein [Pseudorhodoplanes sp.]|nr:pilus assembly protein [Pseudorhodoplanes sp.]